MNTPTSPPPETYNPRRLHVVAFAEAHASLQGTLPLAELPRLATESPASTDTAVVRWQAHGYVRKQPGSAAEIWLDLQAEAELLLDCQRCLQAMPQTITVQRAFRFVRDEAIAQQLDDELEEDVLVYGKQFDLLALVEDELIMALPLAVRHADCQPVAALHDDALENAQQPHPFAALQSLKRKS